MQHPVEVVVVGGGVAGCAAAARLAAAGCSVTVLEKEAVYTDRVRGEAMVNWGLESAIEMGLEQVVLDTPGASAITHLVTYDESTSIDRARAGARDLSTVLPGTPGIVAVGHPDLRRSLAAAAAGLGAVVHRGVRAVTVTPGPQPTVGFQLDGEPHTLTCGLVLVADGKDSPTRRSLGIALQQSTARVLLAGLLVQDGGAWDRTETSIGVVGDSQLYVIPRGDGLVRLYVGRLVAHPERFTGDDREARFLAAFAGPSLPHADALTGAAVVGPCASYPMNDSWTGTPGTTGVVLLGDAAGWSNPLAGQGLAVAFRDAQVATDLFLAHRSWDEREARSYSDERSERMRRLRFACALTDLATALGVEDRRAHRRRVLGRLVAEPELGRGLEALHAGPWRVPESAFTPSILTTVALG